MLDITHVTHASPHICDSTYVTSLCLMDLSCFNTPRGAPILNRVVLLALLSLAWHVASIASIAVRFLDLGGGLSVQPEKGPPMRFMTLTAMKMHVAVLAGLSFHMINQFAFFD